MMFETLENRRLMSAGVCTGQGPVNLASGSAIQMKHKNASSQRAMSVTVAAPLSTVEAGDLQSLARDEKLARDVYRAMYAKWGNRVFLKIANSEQKHFTSVSKLLTKYGVANPVASLPAGQFDDPAVQAMYDQLIAKGNESLASAMQVGVDIEKFDIAALKTAITNTTHAAVKTVYSNLLKGSINHLAAFTRQFDILGALP